MPAVMPMAPSIVRKREADGPDLAADRKHKKPYKLTATAFPDDAGSQMTVGAFRRILSLEGRVRHFLRPSITFPHQLRWWPRSSCHYAASGTRALLLIRGLAADATFVHLPSPVPCCDQMTEGGAKRNRVLLIARLVSLLEEPKLADELITFVLKAPKDRKELALVWLYHQHQRIITLGAIPEKKKRAIERYDHCVERLLAGLKVNLDSKDKLIMQLLVQIPRFTLGALEMVKAYCEDDKRNTIGFLSLRELIKDRPPVRGQCLPVLLGYTRSTDLTVRTRAIRVCKKLGEVSALSMAACCLPLIPLPHRHLKLLFVVLNFRCHHFTSRSKLSPLTVSPGSRKVRLQHYTAHYSEYPRPNSQLPSRLSPLPSNLTKQHGGCPAFASSCIRADFG